MGWNVAAETTAIGVPAPRQANGVRPGRRYERQSHAAPARLMEVIAWIPERAKWQVRTVVGDVLGTTTYISAETIRQDYRPSVQER